MEGRRDRKVGRMGGWRVRRWKVEGWKLEGLKRGLKLGPNNSRIEIK
jgi:hypothetical protein